MFTYLGFHSQQQQQQQVLLQYYMAATTTMLMLMRPLSAAAFVCSTLAKRTAVALVVPISSKTSRSDGHVGFPSAAVAAASSLSSAAAFAITAHSPPPHLRAMTTALYSTSTSNNKQQRRNMSSSSLSDVTKESEENNNNNNIKNGSNTWPRFEEKDNLHDQSKFALQKMGLVTMTEIQAKTFDAAASGRDILARSRTGTGKTIAFLLPALERILLQNINNNHNIHSGMIQMLILCPTRELAIQIGEQTRQLTTTTTTTTLDSSSSQMISHQVMFGGSSRNVDVDRLKKRIPTILIATPGRIQDHLDNTVLKHGYNNNGNNNNGNNNNNNKSFASLFQHTHLLVLDEMDRLLDMGFRVAVEKILSHLPSQQQRQTLLFSATLPADVRHVIARNLKSDFVTVDCIHDADPATHTNDLVQQSHVIASRDELVEATVRVLLHILETDPQAKLICFFPTTKMVKFYAELFNSDGMMMMGQQGQRRKNKVLELHSGKSQAYRTSASNQFRQVSKEMGGGVLFTSDVSARGVDYLDVTHVVQVGMADSRETYLHRLGRTARNNKKGLGIVILSDLEARGYLKTLKGLDIQVNTEMQKVVDSAPSTAIVQQLHPVLQSIRTGQNPSLEESAQASYRGMLGYYRSQLKRIGIPSSEQLVSFANSYSKQTGLVKVPTLLARTARNMGLYGVAGIVCADDGKKEGDRRTNGSTAPRRRSSSSSSIGNQNTWPKKPFGIQRTTSGNAPEGDRRTSTFRNGNVTSPRKSMSSKPFGIKRTTTSGNAADGDRRTTTNTFRNGNDFAAPTPKKQPIKGKSEKWNRRRGKSEWVGREEKAVAWNENETFKKPASRTTRILNRRTTTPV